MENVAPLISWARSLPPARALGEVARLDGDLAERLDVAVAQDRGDQPLVERHRDPDVRAVVDADARGPLAAGALHARVLEQRQGARP